MPLWRLHVCVSVSAKSVGRWHKRLFLSFSCLGASHTEQHPFTVLGILFFIAEYSYGLEACSALPARLRTGCARPPTPTV